MNQVWAVFLIGLTILSILPALSYCNGHKKQCRIGTPGFLILSAAVLSIAPATLGLISGGVTRQTLMYGEVLVEKAAWVTLLERYAIVATALIAFSAIISVISRRRRILVTFALVAPIVIILIAVFGAYYNSYPTYAIRSLALIALVVAVLLYAATDSDSRESLVAGAAMSTVAVAVLSGLLYIVDRASAIRTCRFDKCGFLGHLYQGIYMNENALSLALVAGLPFVLIAAREVRSLNYAAALTCLSIAVAGSRTGQIALVACLITYWVWRSKLSTQLKNALMGLVCVAGLSLQVLVPIVASSGTLTNRPALWRFALNNVEESPWVGKGWNALEQLFRDNGAIAGTSAYSAHNQIIDILLVSGILGLVFFLSLLIVAIFVYPRIDSAILLLLSSSLWLGILERPWNVGYLDWLSWSAVASFAYIASAAFKRARDNQQFRPQAAQKEGELFVPTTDR